MKVPSKTGFFVLEGLNSFAVAFYFNHLLFRLRDAHGFDQLRSLWLLAAFGATYAACSAFAGAFAQRRGYFASLHLGFGGLVVAHLVGTVWTTLPGQLTALTLWTVAVSFTWPVLEALCSEFEPPDRLPDRVGLYNVVWALLGAAGFNAGGWAIERFGPWTLYGLPLLVHFGQWMWVPRLRRERDRFLVATSASNHPARAAHPAGGPRHFQVLAWIANPMAYMAAHVFSASLPALASRLHLSQAEAGLWLGWWNWMRTAGFVALWYWTGWHYRFGLFLGGFLAVIGGFLGIMLGPSLLWVVLAQVAFGAGVALVYYSSLFYAMDGSEAHGEQGGTHEALIGLGMGGGPAVTGLALAWTGDPRWGAAAVSLALGLGLVSMGRIHLRAQRGRGVGRDVAAG